MVTKRHDEVIKSKLHRPLCGRKAILSRPVRHPNLGMDRRSHGYSVLLRPILSTSESDLAQERLGMVSLGGGTKTSPRATSLHERLHGVSDVRMQAREPRPVVG